MKECPICKTEFSDEAEFCPKCKAVLFEKKKEERVPFEGKRLAIAIVCMCGFMLLAAGLYMLMGLLMK